jgi:nucleoside diphosphate kinase
MSNDLSYVLVTPYTIAKSRTGGVLSRLLSRTDLDLVGAQIFLPDKEFTEKYAASLKERTPQDQFVLLADYVQKYMSPSGGRPHRTLMLLFKGKNPCEQLLDVCGNLHTKQLGAHIVSGETICDTYSDLIFSEENPSEIRYFEPAVLTPRKQSEADHDLRMFADYLEGKENVVRNMSYPDPAKIEKTLVIIKPDNWTHNTTRPGAIIDMFSRTGLRIVGIKVHRLSLSEALDFYGPVEAILKEKLSPRYAKKAQELLEKEFDISLGQEMLNVLNADLGVQCAQKEFNKIVEFMSGKRPGIYSKEEMIKPGNVKCMIMVYEGENAINKIRDVLGPTDPLQAPEGTVRREFGSNVMVNTAHASDSADSYEREESIVRINHNSVVSIIREHVG